MTEAGLYIQWALYMISTGLLARHFACAKFWTYIMILFCCRKLCDISQYYFDGKGKAIRPRLALAVADAVNHTLFVGGKEGGGLDEKEMTKLLKNQVYLISQA